MCLIQYVGVAGGGREGGGNGIFNLLFFTLARA